MLIIAMSGCGGTTGGTKPVSSTKQQTEVITASGGPAVSVTKRISYGKNSNVPEKVKAECTLDTKLPAYIRTFAAETDIAVNLKDGAVSKKAKGRVLNVEFSNVVGAGGGAWSGAKFVAVKGELFENGKKIGSFNGRRTSGGGFFGAYKGTCKILDRCVKALGKDIALWMIDPSMDAMIGEF
ncbi:hypothetical protein A3197_11885 [Candidatus Thiodiazotropha endoloripes]|nr:hypothetical protein A3197_11885 [Candidatus Thiodiazotropha endoloripes]